MYINLIVCELTGEVNKLREEVFLLVKLNFKKEIMDTQWLLISDYSLKHYLNKQYAKQIIKIQWTYPNPNWWVIPSAKTAAISTDLFDCLVFTDTRNRSGPLTSSVMTFNGSVDEDKRKTVPKSTWK